MLGSLSFQETAVLSSFQHIKALFLFRCMIWSQAVRLDSRGRTQSGPGVFVNILWLTCFLRGMRIYFFNFCIVATFEDKLRRQFVWPFLYALTDFDIFSFYY